MKTGPTIFSCHRWILSFCFFLAAVTAQCQPSGGLIANGSISFNGNNMTLDSFNSSDPNHSIWQNILLYHGQPYGLYSSTLSYSSNSLPSRTADATMAAGLDIFGIANANIYGYVDTVPNDLINLNNNGSVGDLNWVSGDTLGIEPGHAETNLTQQFLSYSLPTPVNASQSSWLSVPAPPANSIIRIGGYWTNSMGKWTNMGGALYTNAGSGFSIGGTVYHLVITNTLQATTNYVYYCYSNSGGQLTQSIFVDSPNTVLYVPGGIAYSGNGIFTLNTNADVTIYSGGNISIIGNAVINNSTQYARALSIYDLADDPITISADGNGISTAYIYAPSSSMRFLGGGSTTYNFVGGIFCSNLSVNGHYVFHYDESLGSVSPPPITQPILSGFFTPGFDAFTCHVVGTTGLVYSVEASTDLVNWTPVWTNTSPFDFTDTNMSQFPQRFYRSFYNP